MPSSPPPRRAFLGTQTAATLGLLLVLPALHGCGALETEVEVEGSTPPTCGRFDPLDRIDSGSTWAYEPAYAESSGSSAEWTETRLGQDSWDGEELWVVRTEGHYAGEDYTWLDWLSRTYYACDERGVLLRGEDYRSDFEVAGQEGSFWSVKDYVVPLLQRPAEVKVGDRWSIEATWRYLDSTGLEETRSDGGEAVATREGSVSTPAGDWDGLAIEAAPTQAPPYTLWLADGVGPVLSEGFARTETTF